MNENHITKPYFLLLTVILTGLFVFSLTFTYIPTAKSAITDGLVGYWTFDEGSGTTAADSSGNGNNGTLVNGPTWVAGKVGAGALSFDGGNDRVGTGSDSIGTNAITISAWVFPETLGGNSSGNIVTNSKAIFRIISVGRVQFSSNFSTLAVSGINAYSLNNWTFLTITRDSSGISNIYANGVLTGTANQNSGVPVAGTVNVNIGNNINDNQGFDGTIDDLRIYNRVLTSQEITDLYNFTSSTPTPTPSLDTTPPVLSSGSPSGTLAAGTTQTTLSATTDESATCKYGTTSGTAYASIANTFSTTGGTSHSSTITGLTNGVSYSYYVRCQDTAGNANTTDYTISFSVASTTDTTAPVISSITSSSITSSGATITWTTDEASDTQVEYGTTTSYGSSSTLNTALVISHSQSLSSLTANTLYHYRVKSKDAAGNLATSADNTFTTLASSANRVDRLDSSGNVLNTYTTIQACANVVTAGQTCLVYPGLFNERVTPTNSGTAGNVITYKAATDCVPGEVCAKVRGWTISGKSYITVQGFEITHENMTQEAFTQRSVIFSGGTQLWAINNYVHDTISQCLTYGGNSPAETSFVRFAGNTIAYCGAASAVGGTVAGSFTITEGVNDKLKLKAQGASSTITLAAGVGRLAIDIATEIRNAGIGVKAWSGATQKLMLYSSTLGPTASFEVEAVANNAYTTLGLSVGVGEKVGTRTAWSSAGSGTSSDILIENGVASHVADYFTPGNDTRVVYRNSVVGPVDPIQAIHVDAIQSNAATTKTLTEGVTSIDNNSSDNHFFLVQAAPANPRLKDHHIVRFNNTCRSPGGFDVRQMDGLYLYNNTLYDNFAYMNGNNQSQAGPFDGTPTKHLAMNNIWYKSVNTNQNIYARTAVNLTKDYDLWWLVNDPVETFDVNADPLVVGGTSDCNFNLQSTSPAINKGGSLTAVASSDTGSGTTLVVTDARPFQDGWAGVSPDWIAVGTTGNIAQITSIDYANNVITLASAITRSANNPVYLYKNSSGVQVLYGSAPDIGAFEYNDDTTPPPSDTTSPVISSINSSSITSSGATITWTTNESSDTQVEYGTTTSYGSSTTLNTALVTSHSQSLSSLTPNTLYHYRVKSKDAAGNLATSADNTFTTLANPPVISNVQATSITATSVTITWTTDRATTSKINYGLTSSHTSSTVKDTTLVTSHSVSIGGLSSSTLYHYQVESTDSGNLTSVSTDATFTTSAPVLPVISNVQATNIITSGATITWTTDISSDSQVEYGTTTAYGSSTTLDPTLVTSHSVALTGLSAGTTYNYRVKSSGAVSTNKTFSTTSASDTTAPATVTNLASAGTTRTSVDLSWTAPGDDGNTGTATSYDMHWLTVPITDSNWSSANILTGLPNPSIAGTAQTYTAIGLTANTTYYFALKTKDENNNVSVLSNVISAKTKRQPPGQVKNLAATVSSIKLNWSAPDSADSDVKYVIIRNTTGGLTTYQLTSTDTKLAEGLTVTTYTDSTIADDVTYYYSIFAYYDLGIYSSGIWVSAKKTGLTVTQSGGGGGGGGSSSFDASPGPVKISRISEADSQILLEWRNPADEDFARVRIIANENRQPFNSDDGRIILEEKITKFLYANLQNGKTYYFNIYALDLAKNFSEPVKLKAVPKEGVFSFAENVEPLDITQTTEFIAPEIQATQKGKAITPAFRPKIFPKAALIRYAFDKNVYYIENGHRRLVPDYATLLKLTNNNPSKVLTILDSDLINGYTSSGPIEIKEIENLSKKVTATSALVKTKDKPTVYLVNTIDKTRQTVPTLPVFYSYGFSFKNVSEISQEDLDNLNDAGSLELQPLLNGFLMKSPDSYKVYMIQDGQKRWFTTLELFLGFKYIDKDVTTLPKELVEVYPSGADIEKQDESLPARLQFKAPATIHADGALIKLKDDFKVYLIENNRLKWIKTLEEFNVQKYNFKDVITISQDEFDLYGTEESSAEEIITAGEVETVASPSMGP